MFNDLNEFVHDQKTTKADLAAAFLAAFYGNSNTQKSLKDYIDLVNQLVLKVNKRKSTAQFIFWFDFIVKWQKTKTQL